MELIHSVSSNKPGSEYDAGAYVASVASSLAHNMTLELIRSVSSIKSSSQYDA